MGTVTIPTFCGTAATISFYSKSLNARHVWIVASGKADDVDAAVARLQSQPHISEIEVIRATIT
jgi:phosphatidylserine synthase